MTGHDVLYLKRISMGNLILDEKLEKGTFRKLDKEEIESLKKLGEKNDR